MGFPSREVERSDGAAGWAGWAGDWSCSLSQMTRRHLSSGCVGERATPENLTLGGAKRLQNGWQPHAAAVCGLFGSSSHAKTWPAGQPEAADSAAPRSGTVAIELWGCRALSEGPTTSLIIKRQNSKTPHWAACVGRSPGGSACDDATPRCGNAIGERRDGLGLSRGFWPSHPKLAGQGTGQGKVSEKASRNKGGGPRCVWELGMCPHGKHGPATFSGAGPPSPSRRR